MTLRILMHTVLEYIILGWKRKQFTVGLALILVSVITFYKTESFLMPSNDTALIMNKLIYEYLSILYSRELVTV